MRVDLLVAMFSSLRSQVILCTVLFVLFVCLFVIVVYLLLLFSVTRKSLEFLKS